MSKCNLQGRQITSSCIVVVVSPLTALMVDQVSMFKKRGLKAAFVGKEQTDYSIRQQVEKGVFSLVFMSPKSLLQVLGLMEKQDLVLDTDMDTDICACTMVGQTTGRTHTTSFSVGQKLDVRITCS